MKRYYVFGGSIYYAHGGMHDFKGSYVDLTLATDFAKKQGQWWHIFDNQTGTIILKSAQQAWGEDC